MLLYIAIITRIFTKKQQRVTMGSNFLLFVRFLQNFHKLQKLRIFRIKDVKKFVDDIFYKADYLEKNI